MAPNDEEWLKFFHILSDLSFSSRKFNICRSSILGSNFIFHWFRVCWCRTSLEKRKIKFEPRVRYITTYAWKGKLGRLSHESSRIGHYTISLGIPVFCRPSFVTTSEITEKFTATSDWQLSQSESAGHHGTNVKHLLPSTPRETLKRKEGRHAFLLPPPSPLFRRLNVQQGPTVRASTFESFSFKVR